MHLHLFFTTSIGSEEEYTHWVLALIETKGRGEWMWMGVCIEAFRLLFVWFEYIHMYLFGWSKSIDTSVFKKYLGLVVVSRLVREERGTCSHYFFCSSDFFYLLLFRNMQFGEYWGSVRPYVSLSDCLVKADKNLLYCCCCCDGLKTICQIQSCEICYLFFYWSNRTFMWNF